MQRLATLAKKNGIVLTETLEFYFDAKYIELMNAFEFSKTFEYVWGKVQDINKRIDEEKPWSLAKNGETERLQECMHSLIFDLLNANYMLSPFIPQATEKIFEIFENPIAPPEIPLFPKD